MKGVEPPLLTTKLTKDTKKIIINSLDYCSTGVLESSASPNPGLGQAQRKVTFAWIFS
jgi:hypothetical protein